MKPAVPPSKEPIVTLAVVIENVPALQVSSKSVPSIALALSSHILTVYAPVPPLNVTPT